MKIIKIDIFNVKKNDTFNFYPVGDIHLINKACNETAFRQRIKRIEEDKNARVILMGDMCDFINRTDKRFDPTILADWVEMKDLVDLSQVAQDKFIGYIKPIANKVEAVVKGNHERTIQKWYERDIFSNIVTEIKQLSGYPAEKQIGMGYSGWLIISFHRSDKKEATSTFKFFIHHGYVAGRLAGGKSLNLQRCLWLYDADVILFGHSHNTEIMVETVETINSNLNLTYRNKVGAYTGTFLMPKVENVETYSEIAGYFPNPISGVVIKINPYAEINKISAEIIA